MTDIRSDEQQLPELATEDEPVIAAIDELRASLEQNVEDERALSAELAQLRQARLSGRGWRQVLGNEGPVLALSLLGRLLRRLSDAGSSFRRALALSLVAEGDQLSQVAGRFGVSRQRVYSLVRRPPAERPPPPTG